MRILILGVVAGLLGLGFAETAQAQRYRSGWAGVVNSFTNPGYYNQGYYGNNRYFGSGYYGNGYYGTGYNNQYYGSGYNNQYYGSGYNNRYYGTGYNNQYYGNAYNSGSYYPAYSYSSTPTYSYASTPTYSYYPSQQVATPVSRQVPQGEAWIRVLLPDPNAELMFNGLKTSEVGRERTFSRGTHEAGDRNSYTYTASASWYQGGQLITDVRTLVARPGEIVVVDFTQATAPVRLAAPVR